MSKAMQDIKREFASVARVPRESVRTPLGKTLKTMNNLFDEATRHT